MDTTNRRAWTEARATEDKQIRCADAHALTEERRRREGLDAQKHTRRQKNDAGELDHCLPRAHRRRNNE